MKQFDTREVSKLLGSGFTAEQKQGLYKAFEFLLSTGPRWPEFIDVVFDEADEEANDVQ